jgi:hypothetical protein
MGFAIKDLTSNVCVCVCVVFFLQTFFRFHSPIKGIPWFLPVVLIDFGIKNMLYSKGRRDEMKLSIHPSPHPSIDGIIQGRKPWQK